MRSSLTLAAIFLSVIRGFAASGDERWDSQFFEPGFGSGNGEAGARAMAYTASGDLICVGNFRSVAGGMAGTTNIARWDGVNWSSVGGGLPGAELFALVLLGQDIIVGGNFTSLNGQAITNLARWNGTNWSGIGGGVKGGQVRALAVLNGVLYVGGSFTNAGGNTAGFIASWDGTNWNSLNGGMATGGSFPPVQSLLAANGFLYAGGRFLRAGGIDATNIARWNGSTWESIGTGADNGTSADVVALAADTSGTIYLGGAFTRAGTNAVGRVASWDGTNWGTLGGGVIHPSGGSVASLLLHQSALYVGGAFTQAGTNAASGFARWDGVKWDRVVAPVASVIAMASNGSDLVANGTMGGLMSRRRNGLVRINALGVATVIGNGVSGEVLGNRPLVKCVGVSDGKIQAGGYFSGQTPQVIAQWDGTNWSALGNGLLAFGGNPIQEIVALSGAVYAVGRFNLADNSAGTGIGKLVSNAWMNIGSGPRGYGFSLAVSGQEIFVGHNQGVSRWTGSTWTDLGVPLAGPVYALAFIERELYAGGSFNSSGSTPLRNIARWDGTNWSSVGLGVNRAVRTLAVRQGHLFLGGDFTEAGGVACARVAEWNGGAYNALGSGFSNGVLQNLFPDENATAVYDLTFSPDGTLFAGGNFTASGSNVMKHIASWDGARWSPLGSGMDHWVYGVACDGRSLYSGGEFTRAGTNLSYRFARWGLAGTLLSVAAAGAPTVPAGSNLIYTLKVGNAGDIAASAVEMELPIPVGTTFVDATDAGMSTGDRVHWNIGDLAPGQERILHATVNVHAPSGIVVLNECLAVSGGKTFLAAAVHTTILGNERSPSLTIVQPTNGSRFPILSSVPIAFDALDGGHGIRQIDVYQNNAYLTTLVIPPYTLTLSNLRAGTYLVSGLASDFLRGTASTNVAFTIDRPVNDNFTNRISLAGVIATAEGLNHDATPEPGEPNHDGFWKNNSIWWTWRAPADGQLTLDSTGSDFSHVLILYRGTALTNLYAVAAAKNDPGPNGSIFTSDVQAGTNYQIVVDGGYPFTEGHVRFRLAFDHAPTVSITSPPNGVTVPGPANFNVTVNAADVDGAISRLLLRADGFAIGTNFGVATAVFQLPTVAGGSFSLTAQATDFSGQQKTSSPKTINVSLANDLFANRVRISGYRFVGFGTTVGAGAEGGEPGDDWPLDGPRKSVWWEWTAPVSANVTLSAESDEYSAGIQAYTGSTIGQLTRVASDINDFGRNDITFAAVAGTKYQISVDGFHFLAGTAAGKYRMSGAVQGLDSIKLIVAAPTGSQLPFQVEGLPGISFAIQASTNLVDWTAIATNVLVAASTNLQISIGELPKEFYRVVLLP